MKHRLVAPDPAVEALLRRIYQEGSVNLRTTSETFIRKPGKNPGWVLDTTRALLRSENLSPLADHLCERLRAAGISQVAGIGMGGAPLVAGVTARGREINGMLVRADPKQRGLVRDFEGHLDRERPVAVLEDIVNSGRSAARLAAFVRGLGYDVADVFVCFRYMWGSGRRRLAKQDLRLHELMQVHRKRERLPMIPIGIHHLSDPRS